MSQRNAETRRKDWKKWALENEQALDTTNIFNPNYKKDRRDAFVARTCGVLNLGSVGEYV